LISEKKVSLLSISKVFLTIGTIGFGGGMAIIALIQDYCVEKKKWLSSDEFSHGIAFGQILGPFAVNASIFVGYRLRGLTGALVAVISFLFPSIIIVIILTYLYLRFHHIPSLQSALRGIGPVVVALILAAAYQMGRTRIRHAEPVLIIIITILLSIFLKLQIVVILFIAALYGLLKVKFIESRNK